MIELLDFFAFLVLFPGCCMAALAWVYDHYKVTELGNRIILGVILAPLYIPVALFAQWIIRFILFNVTMR